MSVAFGFFVGDFVAEIDLIGYLRKALEDGAGASAEYCELTAGLSTLETALQQAQELELDEFQISQLEAMEQTVLRCQHSVDAFLGKRLKAHPAPEAPARAD
jgi:hypothetical protein